MSRFELAVDAVKWVSNSVRNFSALEKSLQVENVVAKRHHLLVLRGPHEAQERRALAEQLGLVVILVDERRRPDLQDRRCG